MDRILFKESFKLGYKKAKLLKESIEEVLAHTELNWVFDNKTKYFGGLRMPNQKMILPFSSKVLKEAIDKFFNEMSNQKLVEISDQFGLDIYKKHQELKDSKKSWDFPTVLFEINKKLAYDSTYIELVKLALSRFGFDVEYVWPLEVVDDDHLLFAIEDHSAQKIINFIENNYLDEDFFNVLADELDIWGEKLKDPACLLQILIHIGIGMLSVENIYQLDEDGIKNLANLDNDFIEKFVLKNLSIEIVDGTFVE